MLDLVWPGSVSINTINCCIHRLVKGGQTYMALSGFCLDTCAGDKQLGLQPLWH